jgi:flagellar basal body-associated protein FliL
MAQDDIIETGGGGGSKVFLVLGLLLGVAIGGGLGYYYFSSQAPEAAGEQAKKKKPKGPLLSVTFERIAVPIYVQSGNSNRFVGNYFIDLAVQTRGSENQNAVNRIKPQLQHAFISVISKADLMQEDSPLEIDHDKATAALKDKANEVLGDDIVEAISILSAMRLSR